MSRRLFLVNPGAFGGAGSAKWTEFCQQWSDRVDPADVVVTRSLDHARDVAATAQGYGTLVAVGGDGTVREAVVGLLTRQHSRPLLGIIPSGTGNDVARSLGILTLRDGIQALRRDAPRTMDIIQVDCHHRGQPVRRYACLTTSAGISSLVIGCLRPWMKRTLGAQPAYMLATVLALSRYRPPQMTARWSDGALSGRMLMVNIGNAEYESGGSMRMSPGATITDGRANVCVIRSAPKFRLLRKLPLILTGDHIHEPEVTYFTTQRIEVDSDPPAGLQMDGDAFGTTPATFTVLPNALRVLAPAAPEGVTGL